MSALTSVDSPLEVCGTLYAAKMLGLSVGTVQALVEKGELRAWKTKGGHRRIYLDSLKEFRKANRLKVTPVPTSYDLRMMVVDDDQVFLALVKQACSSWRTRTDCIVMDSAIEALMHVNAVSPKVLLTDLHMPKVDGIELVKQLRSNEQFADMHIIVVTALKACQVDQYGPLPTGVLLIEKPLDMRWLDGYVTALVSSACVS